MLAGDHTIQHDQLNHMLFVFRKHSWSLAMIFSYLDIMYKGKTSVKYSRWRVCLFIHVSSYIYRYRYHVVVTMWCCGNFCHHTIWVINLYHSGTHFYPKDLENILEQVTSPVVVYPKDLENILKQVTSPVVVCGYLMSTTPFGVVSD